MIKRIKHFTLHVIWGAALAIIAHIIALILSNMAHLLGHVLVALMTQCPH
jgi:hypothetical protein